MPRREGPAMSLGAIERYNETLLHLGEDVGLRDLDALREGVPRGTLRRWMGEFSPPEGPCYEDARPLTSVDWFPILENRAPDNLPETAFPRWGMVTERCALRLLPTQLPAMLPVSLWRILPPLTRTLLPMPIRRKPPMPTPIW